MSETKTEKHARIDTKKTMTWPELVGVERYGYQIYRLQNEAGLTFKEARAVLTPRQKIRELAEEWGCSYENICNLIRCGIKKVENVTGGDEDKEMDLMPPTMQHIF